MSTSKTPLTAQIPVSNEVEADFGRSLLIGGKEWIYFGGTAYLGISHHPAFLESLREGMLRWGASHGRSRRSTPISPLFEQAEARLAHWMHQEDACLVSSGTLAGQLALRLFEEMPLGHTPGTHPALYRLETRSSAGLFDEWLSQLHKALAQQPQSHWVLLCNSVDPLFAREVRFDWLADLPTDRTFTLLVDDSHGIGLLGPDGGGIGSVLSMPPHIELVVVASLNKALGLPGGVIAGPRHHLEQLRQHPVYNGASPLGPAWLHAFLQSKALYQHQRLRLQDNVRRFMESAPTSFVYRHTEPLPVFAFNQHELVAALAARQILVPSFHYPTTADPLITRLVLTSAHTDHDLDQLVSGL